jgi:hypothetical protein
MAIREVRFRSSWAAGSAAWLEELPLEAPQLVALQLAAIPLEELPLAEVPKQVLVRAIVAE